MTAHSLAFVLAYAGATLGVATVVPQIIRTVRHPHLTGVSVVSWGLTALACSTWLTYGIRTGTTPQIPGNVLLVSGAVLIVLLVPSQTSRARRALTLGSAAAAIIAVALSVPAHAVGYLALGVGLFSSWPQVYDSFVGWRSPDTARESGVSITTWSIKVVSQTCWLTYAVLVRDVPVLLGATVALSTALSLVLVESSRRMAVTGGATSQPVLESA